MTVQDYLGGERRMSADFNRDVAPLGIEDMERVVVHIGHRLLGFDVMVGADVPHRRLGTAYQNQKQALRDIGLCQVFFGQLMLALPGWTMDNRNAIGFRISVNATAKAACQAHQVCVVQRRQWPDESVRADNRIPIRLGQRGARNDDFSFKSATKMRLQMVYELNEKSTN